jgi:hypothetical protein
MLDLNNTQAKILEKLIQVYRNKSNVITEGITGYELDKLGNLSKLFRNHREILLDNYYIRLNKIEHHFTRHKIYYQITPMGVLAYLKWVTTQKDNDGWLDKEFFPLVWKHWEELLSIFGDVLFVIFAKTINRIEIKPKNNIMIKGKVFSLPDLNESITIPLGKTEVKFFREYNSLIKQKIPKKMKDGIENLQDVNLEIDHKITERFTFLLYFNLLNHGIDVGEKINIIMPDQVSIFDQKITNDLITRKQTEINEFDNRMKNNTEKLFSIIRKDKELHKLMSSTISEMIYDLSNRKSLKIISDRLK